MQTAALVIAAIAFLAFAQIRLKRYLHIFQQEEYDGQGRQVHQPAVHCAALPRSRKNMPWAKMTTALMASRMKASVAPSGQFSEKVNFW